MVSIVSSLMIMLRILGDYIYPTLCVEPSFESELERFVKRMKGKIEENIMCFVI